MTALGSFKKWFENSNNVGEGGQQESWEKPDWKESREETEALMSSEGSAAMNKPMAPVPCHTIRT